MDLGTDARAFVEKAIFTKDEFPKMIKPVDQERKKTWA
jgi:hypothetical protein